MQHTITAVQHYVWRIILAVMLLVGTQAYGQIAGLSSSYDSTSTNTNTNNTVSSPSSYSSSSSSNNSGYSTNNNDDSVNVSQLTGLSSTTWSGTNYGSGYSGGGVAGYAASNPSSIPSSSSSSCTGCWSGTAANVSLSGYNENENSRRDDSIDVSRLKNYHPSSGLLSGDTSSVGNIPASVVAAFYSGKLPLSESTGYFSGVASSNPSYGYIGGRPFVGPTMDSDIYTPKQQLALRQIGDNIRAILGRDNTLTDAEREDAQTSLMAADFVAGISNQLPPGEKVAFLDTLWDGGNVLYDAGKYVVGKVTGNQQLVDEAKTDIVWDAAAAAIPFVPAGTTRVLRAADATTNLNRLPSSAPDYIVSPGGTAFPVPRDSVGPVAVVNPSGQTTGSAFINGSGGVNTQVSTMRIMDSTPARGSSPGYPNGYVKYENSSGQGVDAYTGKTLPNSQSHYPID